MASYNVAVGRGRRRRNFPSRAETRFDVLVAVEITRRGDVPAEDSNVGLYRQSILPPCPPVVYRGGYALKRHARGKSVFARSVVNTSWRIPARKSSRKPSRELLSRLIIGRISHSRGRFAASRRNSPSTVHAARTITISRRSPRDCIYNDVPPIARARVAV